MGDVGSGSTRVAIVGTVGVPAQYGGFETLADNLVAFVTERSLPIQFTVYCSGPHYPQRARSYGAAQLRYLPLRANGVQSLLYDSVSMILALWRGTDALLVLGVSGALMLPLVRLFSRARVITNVDGIEWRREKWGVIAKAFLRASEWSAVHFSSLVIADNDVIRDYLSSTYGVTAEVIPYGGEHALSVEAKPLEDLRLPRSYGLTICRIEPENNIELILRAHGRAGDSGLVIVGNWDASAYGRSLREQYGALGNLRLIDPIYDLGKLRALRASMEYYVHGHSAGGTNPSLVEAMHFGKPIIAFDCPFNRVTTEDRALYFADPIQLVEQISRVKRGECQAIGEQLGGIALRRYTWAIVARRYLEILAAKSRTAPPP